MSEHMLQMAVDLETGVRDLLRRARVPDVQVVEGAKEAFEFWRSQNAARSHFKILAVEWTECRCGGRPRFRGSIRDRVVTFVNWVLQTSRHGTVLVTYRSPF